MAFWKTVAVLGVALSAASWAKAKDINYNNIKFSAVSITHLRLTSQVSV